MIVRLRFPLRRTKYITHPHDNVYQYPRMRTSQCQYELVKTLFCAFASITIIAYISRNGGGYKWRYGVINHLSFPSVFGAGWTRSIGMSSEGFSFAFDFRKVNDTEDKLAPVLSKLDPNREGGCDTSGVGRAAANGRAHSPQLRVVWEISIELMRYSIPLQLSDPFDLPLRSSLQDQDYVLRRLAFELTENWYKHALIRQRGTPRRSRY